MTQYVKKTQTIFNANLLARRYSVAYDKTGKAIPKESPDGEFRAIEACVLAMNTEMKAKDGGPEHGKIPQKRNVVLLVNGETREVVSVAFAEKVSIDKKTDAVKRELFAYEGGGQLARVKIDEIDNLGEAIGGAFGDESGEIAGEIAEG